MKETLATLPQALRFWSRLPVPVLAFETDPHGRPDMERLAAVTPLAGAVLGLACTLVLTIVYAFGLSGVPAALFGVAAMVVATGAMHEDGLADMADGFGGGLTVERKLEIMKDSRIGSYGACALMLSLASRITLIGELLYAVGGPLRMGMVLVSAFAVSRIAGLLPLVLLAPARVEGAGAAAGRLSSAAWARGAVPAVVIAAILVFGATMHAGCVLAPLVALLAAFGVAKLAEQQIGGQTGDVCGAATLLAEIAFLAAVLAPKGL